MDGASKKIIVLVGAIILVLAAIYAWPPGGNSNDNTPAGNLDQFAQCLKDKGAVFYGASWCSHCQNQKEMFGESGKFLPYVECSTTAGRGGDQTQECKDKKIEGYPTWEFADGSRLTGEVSLEKLAEKTGCTLPPEK